MKKNSLLIIVLITVSLIFTACDESASSVSESSLESSTESADASSIKPEDTGEDSANQDNTDEESTDSDTDQEEEKTPESLPGPSPENPYYDMDFSFASEDIFGNPVNDSVFKEADLTLLNIFATWCPPCVEEMPYLSSLNEEFKGQSFQVIGFCTDLRNPENKRLDSSAMSTAKELFSSVNSSYPYIIPDESFLNGILFVQYFPTTVFIDKHGRMLGEPVVGSNSYEGWKSEIKSRLEGLNK